MAAIGQLDVEYTFVAWERQHGQVSVLLTRARGHQKMRETKLLPSPGAHEDSC